MAGVVNGSSKEKTISIWDQQLNLVKILAGHKMEITSILLLEDRSLVSSSLEFNLIFWDLSQYKQLNVFNGIYCEHTNGMVEISREKLIVFRGHTLFIINTKVYQIETILNEKLDNSFLSIIELDNGNILCGTSIGLREYKALQCIYIKNTENNSINFMVKHYYYILTSSYDHSIKIWKYE